MSLSERIRDFFGGMSEADKQEYFTSLNSKAVELQQKVDFLHNKHWEAIHKEIKATEDALMENLLLCKDPHESFSLRGQVLGLRHLQRMTQRYLAELQECEFTLEQLRAETREQE